MSSDRPDDGSSPTEMKLRPPLLSGTIGHLSPGEKTQLDAACHLLTWDLDTPLYFLLDEFEQLFPPGGLSFPFCEMGPHSEQLLSTIYCMWTKQEALQYLWNGAHFG